jgi:raffinose/stachyose/melibiose transport system permease protein
MSTLRASAGPGPLAKVVIYAVLIVMTIVALAPASWVMLSSVSSQTDIYAGHVVPQAIDWSGYRDLFADANLVPSLLNTVLYAVGGTLGALAVGLLAAYPSARMTFPLRNTMTNLLSLTLAIPTIGLIVPEFYIALQLGLYNTRLGLLVFYIALFFPLAFVILRAYLVRIPAEIEEAALIDGAGFFTILFRVILPLSRPALVTVAVIIFISIWNEFLFALVLAPQPSNGNVQTVLATFKAQFQFNVTAMLAGTTVVMVVPIIVFLLLQRYVVAGLTAGFSK